jgi:hypothetical protein
MRARQRSRPRTVSAAAAAPLPSDCPSCLPGCQAMFRPPLARQRARIVAAPCLTSLPPREHHVLVPTTCSRLCRALPWHRRRRCGAGALAPPVPAIIRGLPAPPRTAPPIPVAVRPHTPGSSHFRLAPGRESGLQHKGLPAFWRPLRGHGALVGVCGPARLWTSGAGTARAARARSCLVELAWAGAFPGGEAPPDPCQAAAECRSIGLLLPGCVPRGHLKRARAPSPARPP